MEPYTIQDINNKELAFPKAMPLKDSTSDGTSSFGMGRRTYLNMFSNLQTTNAQKDAKKWFGGSNRDASAITEKRRNSEMGKGTMNLEENGLSFCKGDDYNYVNRRIRYTRSAGAAVPPKCRFSKM